MWKNYFKAAFRTIQKNPLFSSLNIMGLAIGISIVSLLLLYLNNEWSFNKYHSNYDQIHRILVDADLGDERETWANAPNAIGPTALAEIAGVESQVRLLKHNFGDLAFVQVGDEKFVQKNFYWVDSSLMDVFDVHLVAGDPNTILHEPNKVLLSESVSDRLFGNSNPIGEIVIVDSDRQLEVSGVYRDFPQNSSLDAEMIGSFASSHFSRRLTWSNSSFETYLLLQKGANPDAISNQLNDMLARNVEEDDRWYSLSLQPLADVHLGSAEITSSYTSRLGDPRQLRLLLYLAIVILLIASINYMNLATARSDQRVKEVAINKTIGASRALLMMRFYAETTALVAVAVLISIAILVLGLPYFNTLADKSFSLADFQTPFFAGGLAIICVIIIGLSGAYPAMYLSRISIMNLFRQGKSGVQASGYFRKGLVVFQFLASTLLIVGTMAFHDQLKFIQNKNLGYEAEQTLAIYTSGAEGRDQVRAMVDRMRTIPEVEEVALAQTFPGMDASGRTMEKPHDPGISVMLQTNRVGPEIVDALSLELLAGRSLPTHAQPEGDSIVEVILNEQAIEFLGYSPEEAIGKEAPGVFWRKRSEIVGVVEDFHFESLHRSIGPYVLHNNPSEWLNYALVKLNAGQLRSTMQRVEDVFKETIPNSAFEYAFLDDHLDHLYASENRSARIFSIFGGLSIFIACLGLFGLAAFKAERRKKEIGIRKIIGARIPSIIYLLSKEFFVLVGVALLLAFPVSWYFLDQWLSSYAYATHIRPGIYVIATVSIVLTAIITIAYQSVRAAVVDPVESLRTE